MAKEVHQQGEEWVMSGVDIVGNTTAGQFLIRSGPDLWRASRKVHRYMRRLLTWLVRINHLPVVIVFIVDLYAAGRSISKVAHSGRTWRHGITLCAFITVMDEQIFFCFVQKHGMLLHLDLPEPAGWMQAYSSFTARRCFNSIF